MSTRKLGSGMTTSRRNSRRRGNQRTKWARRAHLLQGKKTIPCVKCGKTLVEETLCVGRIDRSQPYGLGNIQPICAQCASQRGAAITNALHAPDDTHILRFRVRQPPDEYCQSPAGLWHVAAESYDLSAPRTSYRALCGCTSLELLEDAWDVGELQWSCATWPPSGKRCLSCFRMDRERRKSPAPSRDM